TGKVLTGRDPVGAALKKGLAKQIRDTRKEGKEDKRATAFFNKAAAGNIFAGAKWTSKATVGVYWPNAENRVVADQSGLRATDVEKQCDELLEIVQGLTLPGPPATALFPK